MKLILATFLLVISSLGFAAELVPGLDAYRAKYLAQIEAAPTPAAKDAIHRKVRADLAEWVKKLDSKPIAVDQAKADAKERTLFNNKCAAYFTLMKDEKAGPGIVRNEEFGMLNNTQDWRQNMESFKQFKVPLPSWDAN